MFNRKYKKGMADAAKAYEAFGKKQEEALQHILEEVRQGKKDMETALKELNGNIDDLYNHLKSKEKAQLYTVYTPFDIKNLGEQEKLFLVGALYRLTMDKAPNENQQNYLRAIQKYLEIKDPPFGTDPMAIENIEDIPTQKAILQAVLEFLSLQDGDSYDETELQQNFLDAFSVNTRGRQEIMDHIELLYTATGAKGLAEKYGYVPEEEPGDEDEVDEKPDARADFVELPEDSIDKIVVGKYGLLLSKTIETEHFIIAHPDGFYSIGTGEGYQNAICVDKKTGQIEDLQNYPCLNNPQKLLKATNTSDVLITWYEPDIRDGHIGIFDLANKQYTEIDSGHNMQLLCTQNNYIVYFQESSGGGIPNRLFLYDMVSKKIRPMNDPTEDISYLGTACIDGDDLYILGWQYPRDILLRIKLDGNFTPENLCPLPGLNRQGTIFMKVQGSRLYFLESNRNGGKLYYFDIKDGDKDLYPKEQERGLWTKTPASPQRKEIVGDTERIADEVGNYDDMILYGYQKNGCLEAYRWDSDKKICLVASGLKVNGSAFSAPFIRIGNLIYFEKEGSFTVYKVKLDEPLQVEVVRPQN